ncbi:MAG: PKD domain-containing protein [Candidatus Bipolaricaulota bacterium]|nr:PKD domain-containing protein [Candidatus Bipolaricaulota bacterium]
MLTLGGCFLFNNPHAQFSFDPHFDYPPLTVHFDASASSSPNGAITDYAWDFDDASTDTGESVDHTFYDKGTYAVTLVVTDSSGAVGAITHNVEALNHAPIASFTYWPYMVGTEQPMTFDASDSTDTDGYIVDWAWSFGDGTTGIGEVVDHIFLSAGSQGLKYHVTLTVTDDDGKPSSTSRDVQVVGCDTCH